MIFSFHSGTLGVQTSYTYDPATHNLTGITPVSGAGIVAAIVGIPTVPTALFFDPLVGFTAGAATFKAVNSLEEGGPSPDNFAPFIPDGSNYLR